MREAGIRLIENSQEASLKEYNIDSKPMYWLFVVGIPCLFVAFGSLVMWVWAHDSSSSTGQLWFLAVWLLLMAWGSTRYITMPHTIETTDTGTIRFVGVFRTSTVASADVLSIRMRPGPLIEVRYVGGKVYLLAKFTGFHQFLTELKQANPSVNIRGL